MVGTKHRTCIDCAWFSWCGITGDGYCFASGYYIDPDSSICNEFKLDDYLAVMEG